MNSTLTTEELLVQHKRWSYDRTDRNGTRYFFDYTCGRCGGRGGWEGWPGFTCYDCGGSGKDELHPTVIKVYTPEHEAKLQAQREARAKKREEEAFARLVATYDERIKKIGFGKENDEYVIYRVMGETYSIKDQLKELGCKFKPQVGWYSDHELEGYATQRMTSDMVLEKNFPLIEWKSMADCKACFNNPITGNWVGEVGERLQLKLHIDRVIEGSGFRFNDGPWGHTSSYLILMSDKDGNEYKWSTTCWYKEGEDVEFKATVKAHETYNDKKQTVLTRCTKVKG